MLRISKLTDYGTLVMTYLAREATAAHPAKTIALQTHLSLPTVSKLLKLLAKGELLRAERGAQGGYRLARPAAAITLEEIVASLEGNIGLTECSQHKTICVVQTHCGMSSNWQFISATVRAVLQSVTLADLLQPLRKAAKLTAVTQQLSPPPRAQ